MPDGPPSPRGLYEADLHAWALRQAELVRAGAWEAVDRTNLAEELDALARSERRELTSRIEVVLLHLMKWRHQPERRGPSWRLTLKEQRRRLARLLNESPSLRARLDGAVAEAYGDSLIAFERETGIEAARLPAACPFSPEEILADDFIPTD